MALAVYVKEYPQDRLNKKKSDRKIYVLVSTVGLVAVLFAMFPSIVWQFKTLPRLTAKPVELPIPTGQVLSSGDVLGTNVQVIAQDDGFSYFATDFKPKGPRPKEFEISIPKLEIENAKAAVDSLRFDKQLSHFPGSAVPGQVGNSFITGHSVLSQFNDPQNYKAIFTKLTDLEVGDDIYVDLEGVRYHYVVQYSKVVSPKDLSVLAPISQNGKNLTLMTCVPPGTNIKRLVVVTSLI